MKDRTIRILGRETEDGESTSRGMTRLSDFLYEEREVKASTLQARMGEFVTAVKQVVSSLPSDFGELHLDSVTITAEVNAKGQFILLGAGGELAGKGGISFVLKRSKDSNAP